MRIAEAYFKFQHACLSEQESAQLLLIFRILCAACLIAIPGSIFMITRMQSAVGVVLWIALLLFSCLTLVTAIMCALKLERDNEYYRDRTIAEINALADARKQASITLAQRHASRAHSLAAPGGDFTADEWLDLCFRSLYRCLRCNRREPHIQLSPDHVMPLSKGGSNQIGNIQPLCVRCNKRKGAQFIDYRKKAGM